MHEIHRSKNIFFNFHSILYSVTKYPARSADTILYSVTKYPARSAADTILYRVTKYPCPISWYHLVQCDQISLPDQLIPSCTEWPNILARSADTILYSVTKYPCPISWYHLVQCDQISLPDQLIIPRRFNIFLLGFRQARYLFTPEL